MKRQTLVGIRNVLCFRCQLTEKLWDFRQYYYMHISFEKRNCYVASNFYENLIGLFF